MKEELKSFYVLKNVFGSLKAQLLFRCMKNYKLKLHDYLHFGFIQFVFSSFRIKKNSNIFEIYIKKLGIQLFVYK